jgi:transcriptional regulator NrdR family protein
MNCPKCGSESRVRESYAGGEFTQQRQRKCKECGNLFYTTETIVENNDAYREAIHKYTNCDYRRAYQKMWRKERKERKK